MPNIRSTTSGTGDIQCPFFIAHSKTEIICEGDLPEAKNIHSFRNLEDKRIQQRVFCEQHYKKCPHYINIVRWGWERERKDE